MKESNHHSQNSFSILKLIMRYVLGLGMMYYGFTKIMHTQFVVLPTSVWRTALADLTGKNITWAFLGYSVWFQTLLGLLEFVPAFFLLFRRTSFMGALFLFPMVLSVTLINFGMDLWPQTQVIASVFLALNIGLLCLEYPKIESILRLIFSEGIELKKQRIELILGVVVSSLLVIYCYAQLSEYKNDSNELTGSWMNKKPYEWVRLAVFKTDTIESELGQKLCFMPFGMLEEHYGNTYLFGEKYYEYDTLKNTLTLRFTENDSIANSYSVRIDSDTLTLTKDSGSKSIFIKQQINPN